MVERGTTWFERLSQLHRDNPEEFERARERLIRETIEGFDTDYRQRAYGLQFQIDCQLSKYQDPVPRMNKMVEILWRGVADFKKVMTDPCGVVQEREHSRSLGKILPFSQQDRQDPDAPR